MDIDLTLKGLDKTGLELCQDIIFSGLHGEAGLPTRKTSTLPPAH